MIIGCVISFLIFGGLAYFISKACLNFGLDQDNKLLAVFSYFLGPLVALSALSLLIVAAYSMFGFSVSLIAEGIANSFDFGSSGLLVFFGSILTLIYGIAAVGAGPATAFTASQVSSVVALIAVFVTKDNEMCKTWLPRVAAGVYGFCMWPFAAILTFGL